MTSSASEAPAGWSLDLAEDIDLPGWVLLPSEVDENLRGAWTAEVAAAVIDLARQWRPGVTPPAAAEIEELLDAGLTAREESTSSLLYLVFPTADAVALFCSIDLVRAADLPELSEREGRMYTCDARYIGPGFQLSTRRRVEHDGVEVDVSSVHLVFTDDDHGVMMSLGEAGSLAVSRSLLAFGLLKDALVVRRPDGTALTSIAPTFPVEDSEWENDTEGVS